MVTLYNVRCSGCTALGPALALSNGIASQMPGSQIIVCTDGEANLGVGSIKKGDKSFYADMGELAIQTATIKHDYPGKLQLWLRIPWLRVWLSSGSL